MKLKLRGSITAALFAITCMAFASSAYADDMDDVMAVVDAYIATESNLTEQAKLMTDDRVYIVGGARFTDNVANMRGQIAGEKLRQAIDPDGVMIVTAEDPMVKLFDNTAVASFYRHWNWIPGADAVRAGNTGAAPPSQVTTVVLNKMGSDWKIVHTHISPMRSN